jgi:hypothetical protein
LPINVPAEPAAGNRPGHKRIGTRSAVRAVDNDSGTNAFRAMDRESPFDLLAVSHGHCPE